MVSWNRLDGSVKKSQESYPETHNCGEENNASTNSSLSKIWRFSSFSPIPM
jgi:hypothetical protein